MLLFEKRYFIFIFLIFFVKGCGFTPVYKDSISNKLLVGNLAIVSSNTKEGFYIREIVLRRFGISQNPIYELTIITKISKKSEIITSTNEITSYNLFLDADFILTDSRTKKEYLNLSSSAKTSYSATATYTGYATQAAENDALKRLSQKIAEDIILRLLITFARE